MLGATDYANNLLNIAPDQLMTILRIGQQTGGLVVAVAAGEDLVAARGTNLAFPSIVIASVEQGRAGGMVVGGWSRRRRRVNHCEGGKDGGHRTKRKKKQREGRVGRCLSVLSVSRRDKFEIKSIAVEFCLSRGHKTEIKSRAVGFGFVAHQFYRE